MKSIKYIPLVAALSFTAVPVQAGIWDTITSFFSDTPAAETAPEQPPKTADIVATGLKLIPLLTQVLSVNGAQAEGGMGALLQAAQGLMSDTDFGKLTDAIPGASALMAAAPALASDSGGLLGSAMQAVAEPSGSAKAGLDLVSQFKSLGMGADMIPKFTDVAKGYLTDSGSGEVGSLFKSVMPSL